MVVAPDMHVAVAYRLFDEAGTEVDAVGAEEPLTYVHGYAQIIPGLEAGLEGARVGERKSLTLPAELAFGGRDEGAVLEIDRRDFPDAGQAAVGDEIVAEAPDGTEVAYRVVAVTPEILVADRNHPLAGQTVRFDVEVLSVRPADDDELDACRADADERVVYESTIVYGSEPSDGGRAASDLVELRRKTPGGTPKAGDEEQP